MSEEIQRRAKTKLGLERESTAAAGRMMGGQANKKGGIRSFVCGAVRKGGMMCWSLRKGWRAGGSRGTAPCHAGVWDV